MSPFNPNSIENTWSLKRLPIVRNILDYWQQLETDGPINQSIFKKLLWVFFLVSILIFCQHNLEGLVKRKEKARIIMQENRATYIQQKATYMYESKHSEVSKKLTQLGMTSNLQPPVKIKIEE